MPNSHGTELTGGCELPDLDAVNHSGPPEEQDMLLMAETFVQSQHRHLLRIQIVNAEVGEVAMIESKETHNHWSLQLQEILSHPLVSGGTCSRVHTPSPHMCKDNKTTLRD